jgi:hypothetical protein
LTPQIVKFSLNTRGQTLELLEGSFYVLKDPRALLQLCATSLDSIGGYLAVGVLFVSFVVANGGIVVGDKQAHTVNFHPTQVFAIFLFPRLPLDTGIRFLHVSGIWCQFFVHFFRGKFWGKFRGKFSPKKCWKKMEFSAEKVLKNCFSKKFHGIVQKIGRRRMFFVFSVFRTCNLLEETSK